MSDLDHDAGRDDAAEPGDDRRGLRRHRPRAGAVPRPRRPRRLHHPHDHARPAARRTRAAGRRTPRRRAHRHRPAEPRPAGLPGHRAAVARPAAGPHGGVDRRRRRWGSTASWPAGSATAPACPGSRSTSTASTPTPTRPARCCTSSAATCRAASPVLAKLSPGPGVADVARAVVKNGADAVVLAHGFPGVCCSTPRRCARPSAPAPARSAGRPCCAQALRCVWDVHAALPDVPLVGAGGVRTGFDVVADAAGGRHRRPGRQRPAQRPRRHRAGSPTSSPHELSLARHPQPRRPGRRRSPPTRREPPMTFGSRLRSAIDGRGRLCVGIDPHPALLDAWGLTDSAFGVEKFAMTTVEALAGTGRGRQAAVGVLRAARLRGHRRPGEGDRRLPRARRDRAAGREARRHRQHRPGLRRRLPRPEQPAGRATRSPRAPTSGWARSTR